MIISTLLLISQRKYINECCAYLNDESANFHDERKIPKTVVALGML